MKTETKYDVGRTVWVIDSNATFAKCPKCRQHLKRNWPQVVCILCTEGETYKHKYLGRRPNKVRIELGRH